MNGEWSTAFTDSLAERWDDYVDCRRRVMVEGPFLRKLVERFRGGRVFDAGAALGCEASFFAKSGCDVVANEIDQRLARRARMLFAAQRLKITITNIDWRDLRTAVADSAFDGVVLVGNSLGLLSAAEHRRLALINLWRILKPGGFLVIDQRNYDYMLADRVNILQGVFRYSARVMYCERSIIGRPTVIESGRVRLTCFDKFTGRALGHFDVHPFLADELDELLRHCGFSPIETFYDFGERADNDWDFKTIIARKA